MINGSKMARYSSSLSNLPSGGGIKKQVTPTSVGVPATVHSIYQNKTSACCRRFSLVNLRATSNKGSVGHIATRGRA